MESNPAGHEFKGTDAQTRMRSALPTQLPNGPSLITPVVDLTNRNVRRRWFMNAEPTTGR